MESAIKEFPARISPLMPHHLSTEPDHGDHLSPLERRRRLSRIRSRRYRWRCGGGPKISRREKLQTGESLVDLSEAAHSDERPMFLCPEVPRERSRIQGTQEITWPLSREGIMALATYPRLARVNIGRAMILAQFRGDIAATDLDETHNIGHGRGKEQGTMNGLELLACVATGREEDGINQRYCMGISQ